MNLPHLVHAGSASDPLVVVRSDFWNFQGIGTWSGDEALVIDPGFYPEDIALLSAAVRTRVERSIPRRVRHVVLTHSHHDHIRGWQRFPDAEITMPQVAADKPADAQKRILAAKRTIDDSLGIDDRTFTWPVPDRTFEESCTLEFGAARAELHFLPGHSNCSCVVWLPHVRTLCTADYLVSPGLPYCRWEMPAFESALTWIELFVRREGVRRVVPAHNHILEGQDTILRALALETEYVAVLRNTLENRPPGEDPARGQTLALQAMKNWRGSQTRAEVRQDRDNAQRMQQALTD
ncbi:MAG: MBL fold metallo-hydrolase [Planctomycetota bacterium]